MLTVGRASPNSFLQFNFICNIYSIVHDLGHNLLFSIQTLRIFPYYYLARILATYFKESFFTRYQFRNKITILNRLPILKSDISSHVFKVQCHEKNKTKRRKTKHEMSLTYRPGRILQMGQIFCEIWNWGRFGTRSWGSWKFRGSFMGKEKKILNRSNIRSGTMGRSIC